MNQKERKKKLTKEEQTLLKRLGKDIRDYLKKSGRTAETVATEARIARSTFRDIMAGTSNVGVLNLRSIAKAMGYPSLYDYLFQAGIADL